MISVSEALNMISANCTQVRVERKRLVDAAGYVLASPVYSPVNTPPFHQSAMDGYAFNFESWDGKSDLKICGEIQAGKTSDRCLKPLEAVRIFTGAALPEGADTVVMQEQVIKKENCIQIENTKLIKGANVRPPGSQTTKGELALKEGQFITAPAISFLAGIGIEKVEVFSNPSISIIITGKELVQPGQVLEDGKIYESNSFGLIAGLHSLGITPASVEIVDDREEEIASAIRRNLDSDILLLTGGVSVGDYDLVPKMLEECGVNNIFHKVKQKPGKPLYFGKRNQTLVFGLPGNPASVLTCFYEYVVPAINHFIKKEILQKIKMPLATDYTKKAGLTFFLKGRTKADGVAILDNQESYKMNSFALADCLIELEEGKEHFRKGDIVNVLIIVGENFLI